MNINTIRLKREEDELVLLITTKIDTLVEQAKTNHKKHYKKNNCVNLL